MGQFVGYLVGAAIVGLSIWARLSIYKPDQKGPLTGKSSADLSRFRSDSADVRDAADPTSPDRPQG